MQTMRDAFLNRVYEAMKIDDSIFVLTADFGAPALDRIASDFPDRFCSVGIAEQNLVNAAAGLALEGRKVIAYAIAPFFLRAVEQIRINLCMNAQFRPVNVTMVGVGAGFSYEVSGPSHHALEDLAMLHALSGLRIITPSDAALAASAFSLMNTQGIRYLRLDSRPQEKLYPEDFAYPDCGYSLLRSSGEDSVALAASGSMVHEALLAADFLNGIKIRVVDVFEHTRALAEAMPGISRIFTMEEGVLQSGGLDSFVQTLYPQTQICSFGISSSYQFTAHTRTALRRRNGLTAEQLNQKIREVLSL